MNQENQSSHYKSFNVITYERVDGQEGLDVVDAGIHYLNEAQIAAMLNRPTEVYDQIHNFMSEIQASPWKSSADCHAQALALSSLGYVVAGGIVLPFIPAAAQHKVIESMKNAKSLADYHFYRLQLFDAIQLAKTEIEKLQESIKQDNITSGDNDNVENQA